MAIQTATITINGVGAIGGVVDPFASSFTPDFGSTARAVTALQVNFASVRIAGTGKITVSSGGVIGHSVQFDGAGSIKASAVVRSAARATLAGQGQVYVTPLLPSSGQFALLHGVGSFKTSGVTHTGSVAITLNGVGSISVGTIRQQFTVGANPDQSNIRLPKFSAADFQASLVSHFPRGAVWPREPDAVQVQAMSGLAPTYQRQTDRATHLLVDGFPSTTAELLPEWELTLGLPDHCTPLGATLSQRQAAVRAKFISLGGESVGVYIALARSFGITITITEFVSPNQHVWQVNAPLSTTTFFYAGSSLAGDPLATYGNTEFECRITEAAPAHTRIIFNYT